jgi:hypothetical protein
MFPLGVSGIFRYPIYIDTAVLELGFQAFFPDILVDFFK